MSGRVIRVETEGPWYCVHCHQLVDGRLAACDHCRANRSEWGREPRMVRYYCVRFPADGGQMVVPGVRWFPDDEAGALDFMDLVREEKPLPWEPELSWEDALEGTPHESYGELYPMVANMGRYQSIPGPRRKR